jgi:HEAT repeat protein
VLRDGGGNVVVLMHYRGAGDDSIDRAAYRSAKIGFDFERKPLFWLGYADEAQSFERVRGLFERARAEDIQKLLIELASMHGNSNVVIPFLTRLVELSQPSAIRHEAAEGFGHHHEPRSVEILLRVARTDPMSEVRAEAAETIGDVQTPQAVPALIDLVDRSEDPEVVNEAVEALGAQDDPRALDALVRIVWEHDHEQVQHEAVETIGDRHEDAGAMPALERIVREHQREGVVSEAIETLTDLSGEALHPLILELAASGQSPRVRRDAIEAIGDAVSGDSNAQLLDRAEHALERAVFDDPDSSVRMEALDAMEQLPRTRAAAVLQRVIDRHTDTRVRREAQDHLRDLKR